MKYRLIRLILSVALISCIYGEILAQDSMNKFIHIEWEKNDLAAEYHLQISDSVKFLDILYQKKTKESLIRLEPNPKYKYGRIAGIDQHGVRGEYSEVFEIEQRIVEKKAPEPVVPLPSNYLGENHLIVLDTTEDKGKHVRVFYKINDGKWLTYQGGITLTKQGVNLVQYYSEDLIGNRERIKTMEYILDTEGPKIDISFQNSYLDKDKITFTGRDSRIEMKVSDLYSGIQSTQVFLRTIYSAKEVEPDNKGVIPISSEFADSTIELFVVSKDRLGNVKTYSRFFKHDLMPPELTIDSITRVDGNARKISINHIQARDYFSGLKNIFYSLNNSEMQTYLEPILILEPGEHELKMQAVDNVGNRTTVQSERIFIPEPVKNNSIQKDRLK